MLQPLVARRVQPGSPGRALQRGETRIFLAKYSPGRGVSHSSPDPSGGVRASNSPTGQTLRYHQCTFCPGRKVGPWPHQAAQGDTPAFRDAMVLLERVHHRSMAAPESPWCLLPEGVENSYESITASQAFLVSSSDCNCAFVSPVAVAISASNAAMASWS